MASPKRTIFNSLRNLSGRSFSYGLAPPDYSSVDSGEFVESPSLSVLVDEDGDVNVSGSVKLFAGTDPIDSDKIPTFSKGNKFVAGLEKVLPGVPAGGIIAYTGGNQALVAGGSVGSLPGGFVRADGKVYKLASGRTWFTPTLPPGPGFVWIVRLPEGAEEI